VCEASSPNNHERSYNVKEVTVLCSHCRDWSSSFIWYGAQKWEVWHDLFRADSSQNWLCLLYYIYLY